MNDRNTMNYIGGIDEEATALLLETKATVHLSVPWSASRHSAKVLPLVLDPKRACRVLGIGLTRLYQLLRDRELRSYTDGRARKIVVASIEDYVARQIAAPHSGELQVDVVKAANVGRRAGRANRTTTTSRRTA